MASQTLRPHRSPSPGPLTSDTVNPSNPAKLTRQSLGPPPTASSGAAKGFSGLGISSPNFGSTQPRHVSSSVALGQSGNAQGNRDTNSSRPSYGNNGNRAVSGSAAGFGGPRPSSEFLPGGPGSALRGDARTPEAEQIDQWFKHLASWENTLEEMAAASTDQNFTEELGAIEQWFRVLSEAERTAALYSLLQHSTPVQIRFFLSVLHHMSQSDPIAALLSPNPNAGMEQKLAGLNLKSPSAGGGSGFPGSPTVSQFLGPESALDPNSTQAKNKARQNRFSSPGTLQPSDRWQGQLDQVVERGTSPGAESTTSSRSRSPQPDMRPKSTDFSGKGDRRSPRLSAGVGLGLHQPVPEAASPVTSPFLSNNASWASMVNTPLAPMFNDPKVDNIGSQLNMANLNLANQSRVAFEDARKFRRPGAGGTERNVSGRYDEETGRATSPLAAQAGFPNQSWARSPVLDQFGLSGLGLGGTAAEQAALAGLGVNFANFGLGGGLGNANAAQMLALAQAQQQLNTAASFASAGYGGLGNQYNQGGRGPPRGPPGRRSPMLGQRNSPTPDRQTGGGAGGGGGVAGPDDVDMKVLEDVTNWLRVLRLHKYTTNFEKSNWKEMTMMTDTDLQDNGVSAQGARTKFLKVFYNVREKQGIAHPPGQEEYAPGAAKDGKEKD